jgi:hypothetical protein
MLALSCYIWREFKGVLREYGLTHQRTKPHCPEENGLVVRSNRTLREALEEMEFSDPQEAEQTLERIILWYNDERLHSALGFLRPKDYYYGQSSELHEARRKPGISVARRTWGSSKPHCSWKLAKAPLNQPTPCATTGETTHHTIGSFCAAWASWSICSIGGHRAVRGRLTTVRTGQYLSRILIKTQVGSCRL